MKKHIQVNKRRLLISLFSFTLLTISNGLLAAPNGNYVLKYDAQNETEYFQRWENIYGPLELAAGAVLSVSKHETTVSAVPFHMVADYSVYDHLKYIAVSTEEFSMPVSGSLEFSVDIVAQTPGTETDRLIKGCYGLAYSYQDVNEPCDNPYSAIARQGQQAGVVLNMINFETGQLFDWFISENKAFALIERLPSNVTGLGETGVNLAYTQIIKEVDIKAGKKHNVAIRYTRGEQLSYVEYFLDGKLFTRVDNVGIPLDKQNVAYSGYAPSLGDGEDLKDRLNSFVIGHGLFSLLDAFPYQHPDALELSVSIPESERLFGQGAIGTWSNFKVTQKIK
ncbi:DUF6081 family protein [Paraglaciecola sp. 25GB23A]|uniref:DUF6081 family protein n=1 Tax=Paraglaciecola sp. 25GB23A TaxID=3156068 RepID=UPI0032AED3D3